MRHKDEDQDQRAETGITSKGGHLGPPPVIDVGIDLSEFYMSVEWDILQVLIRLLLRFLSSFL